MRDGLTRETLARVVREAPQALASADVVASAVGVTAEAASRLLVLAGGSVRGVAALPDATVASVPGIGPARVARIRAVVEWARRHEGDAGLQAGAPMRGPRDVAAVFAARLQDLPVEEFHLAILDTQHRLRRDVLVTRGLVDATLVHPREVFREAIAECAAAVILVHNHPSGDPTPSAEDRAVTEQLVAAGRLLDIPVHDHIIIGRGRYVSFAEAGLL